MQEKYTVLGQRCAVFLLPQHTSTYKETLSWKYKKFKYEGWNFNSGNYLFTTDTK